MCSAHLAHYRAMAERLDREWYGPDQLDWADWAEADLAEIRLALDYGISHGGAPPCLDLVSLVLDHLGRPGADARGPLLTSNAPWPAALARASSYARALWVPRLDHRLPGRHGPGRAQLPAGPRRGPPHRRRGGDGPRAGPPRRRAACSARGAPTRSKRSCTKPASTSAAAGASDTIDDLVIDGGAGDGLHLPGRPRTRVGRPPGHARRSRRRGEIWMRAFGDLFRSQLDAGLGATSKAPTPRGASCSR